jgi:hypothetical protein
MMRLQCEIDLPCGCVLKHSYHDEGPTTEKTVLLFMEHAAKVTGYWATSRMQWHRCELVAADNPTGFDRDAYDQFKKTGQMELPL